MKTPTTAPEPALSLLQLSEIAGVPYHKAREYRRELPKAEWSGKTTRYTLDAAIKLRQIAEEEEAA